MHKPVRSTLIVVALLTLSLVLSMSLWTGCNTSPDLSMAPAPTQQGVVLSKDNPEVAAVMAVQDRNTPSIMSDKNVVGTATGLTDDGKLAILVFLAEGAQKGVKSASSIPAAIDGIPVLTEVTGPIRAMKGGGVSHTAKQTPPISLGTSGGWRYDLANGYCCGGTLGSLVTKGGAQYILSNYHVLWGDIAAGGNNRVATVGDPVIQPGLIDVSCNASGAQNVGTLAGSASLPGSNVDVGLAQVVPGMVRTDGAILEVGTISASTVGASVGQAVKKSGRTSGLTRTTVYALNATITVGYETECAGSAAFNKTFTGQIVLKGGRFIQAGDSGSLLVEDATTNPRAVGLCFAGSSTYGFANPIGQVLSWAGATMVGQ